MTRKTKKHLYKLIWVSYILSILALISMTYSLIFDHFNIVILSLIIFGISAITYRFGLTRYNDYKSNIKKKRLYHHFRIMIELIQQNNIDKAEEIFDNISFNSTDSYSYEYGFFDGLFTMYKLIPDSNNKLINFDLDYNLDIFYYSHNPDSIKL